MAKKTINRQQLLLEFVSIVFAVLLALLLNAWRESVTTERTLNKVKQSIISEIRKNDSSVRQAMEYRRALVDELTEGRHVVAAFAISDYPVNARNDRALEKYMRQTQPFHEFYTTRNIEVKRLGAQRVLIMDDLTMKLVERNDSLILYGATNLQLRSADVSNRFWEISQATGMLVQMELELVDALNKAYNLNSQYLTTSDKAIDMIYQAKPGIISVMQDMYYFESQILKADSVILSLLAE